MDWLACQSPNSYKTPAISRTALAISEEQSYFPVAKWKISRLLRNSRTLLVFQAAHSSRWAAAAQCSQAMAQLYTIAALQSAMNSTVGWDASSAGMSIWHSWSSEGVFVYISVSSRRRTGQELWQPIVWRGENISAGICRLWRRNKPCPKDVYAASTWPNDSWTIPVWFVSITWPRVPIAKEWLEWFNCAILMCAKCGPGNSRIVTWYSMNFVLCCGTTRIVEIDPFWNCGLARTWYLLPGTW